MNRTTTLAVALIVAAGLTTMVYAVPAQRAFACRVGCGVPYPVPVPVPVPVFSGFFVHKTIIQTINQVNNCTGNGEEQKYSSDHQDENQKDKQTICLNTGVNNAGRGLGTNNIGSGNLGSTGSGKLENTGSGNLENTGSGNLGQSDVPDNLLP
jgi:hypothetical protein